MPAVQDIFEHILAGVKEAFPAHDWEGPTYKDSDLGEVSAAGKDLFVQGTVAAQHTDPTIGAVGDIFQSSMPVANPTTLPIPGNPNYVTPGYFRSHT